MPDALRLTTDLVDPDQRSDLWREIHRPFFDTEPDDGILEGSLNTWLLGGMLLGEAAFNAQRCERGRRILRQGSLEDHYLVQLYLGGMGLKADCEDRILMAGPGDIYVFDLARMFNGRVDAGRTFSMVLPRVRLDRVANGRNLHGVVLKSGSPFVRLLSNFILDLPQVAGKVTSDEALAIEEAILALLTSALARHAPAASTSEPVLSHILRRRVLEFIDANLARPELGPAMLMRRFRVSRAHLYRMFAAEGGVATLVRERRLDAAYRELVRAGAQRPVAEVAHDFGFSGRSQFLRAFRAHFGMTPSDARFGSNTIPRADEGVASTQAHFARIAGRHGGREER